MCMDIHPNPGPTNQNHDTSTLSSPSVLNILHLNVRSIRHKLECISDISDDYDVLCFSETHLDDTINSPDILLEGFNTPFRRDRTCRGGGLLVYVSSSFVSTRRLDLESPDIESVWIELVNQPSNFLICTFYRPPNTQRCHFLTLLEQSIEKSVDISPYVVLVGDINIDLLNR